MENNFKNLLEAIYWTESLKPVKDNTFVFETDFSNNCVKQIEEQFQELEREKVSGWLDDLQNEMLNIGYINGFRNCLKLISELSRFRDAGFMAEILYGKAE